MRCHTCDAEVPADCGQQCIACRAAAGQPLPSLPAVDAAWRWFDPDAAAAIATGDLATILRAYRGATRTSQKTLALRLGYDPTYISAIENGRRTITCRADLRRIATHLGLAPHTLGITDANDTDYHVMLQFAASTIRLADITRNAGRPADAINEIWPLIIRLETRAAAGGTEPTALSLLARARAQLGVFLGDILPEQHLATAARWTGRAIHIARRLDDTDLHTHTLQVHGNELRKAGNPTAAIRRLQHATALAPADNQPARLIALARAAAEAGHADLFHHTIDHARRVIDQHLTTPLFNDLVIWEVHTRGLLQLAHPNSPQIIGRETPQPTIAAPQWRVIAAITCAQTHTALGDTDAATPILTDAITSARHHRLPHQIQRAIRVADHNPDITQLGRDALAQLAAPELPQRQSK